MREDLERSTDLLAGGRRARRARRPRRGPILPWRLWVLTAAALSILALLLIGMPLYLLAGMATADQAFPPVPRIEGFDLFRELGSRTSMLAPAWYAGSWLIGVLAGLAGDRVSLGFVAETERQVRDVWEQLRATS